MHARGGGRQCQWRGRMCWLRYSRDRGVYAGNCIRVFLLQNGDFEREQICETIPLTPRTLGPRGLRPHRNRQGNPSTPSDSGHAGSARRYGHTDAIKGLACSAGLGGARVALLLPDVDQRCLQWRRRDFDQSRERLVHLDYEKHGATD